MSNVICMALADGTPRRELWAGQKEYDRFTPCFAAPTSVACPIRQTVFLGDMTDKPIDQWLFVCPPHAGTPYPSPRTEL